MNCTQCCEKAVEGLCELHWQELEAEIAGLRNSIKEHQTKAAVAESIISTLVSLGPYYDDYIRCLFCGEIQGKHTKSCCYGNAVEFMEVV